MENNLKNIDILETCLKWNRGTGPFTCFFRTTNFVSLKHYPDFKLHEVSIDGDYSFNKLVSIIEKYNTESDLFLLDLPGEDVIKQAFLLQNSKKVKPILTFNSPLHQNGLVGSEKYISLLLSLGNSLEDVVPNGYAFILDYNRFGDYSREDYQKYFNNQYEMVDEHLPPIEMLNYLKFDKVVYIYNNEEKEDIQGYLDYLASYNFKVYKENFLEDCHER